MKRRIRRKARVRAPSVRKAPSAPVLNVGGAMDPAEKVADTMARAALTKGNVTGRADGVLRSATAAPATAPGANSAPAPEHEARAVAGLGRGRAMSANARDYFEPRFGHDFSAVRVHTGAAAGQAARALDAKAFTNGTDIAFASPEPGRRTMAHELAHVAGGGNAPQNFIRRDLAIEPPTPDAVVPDLTDRQRVRALRYNQRRFEDPFTISIIRDVYGTLPKFPAVIDDDFVTATVAWQTRHALTANGLFDIATTRSLVSELEAEGEDRLARLVRMDNYVQVSDINGPTFTPIADPAQNNMRFAWDVGFRTSLRNGAIVQRIDSEWNETTGPGITPRNPVARYWETWNVDQRGRVSPAAGQIHDMWRRPFRQNTRGTWRMRGTLFSVLSVPGIFAGQGAAGHVGASGVLPSTSAMTGAQQEGLGPPAGNRPIQLNEPARGISGEWNGMGPQATWFNRRTS